MKLLPLITVAVLLTLSVACGQVNTTGIQERASDVMDSLTAETAQSQPDQRSEPAMTATEVWQHIDAARKDPNKARAALLDGKEFVIQDQVSSIADGYLVFETPDGPVSCAADDNPTAPWTPAEIEGKERTKQAFNKKAALLEPGDTVSLKAEYRREYHFPPLLRVTLSQTSYHLVACVFTKEPISRPAEANTPVPTATTDTMPVPLATEVPPVISHPTFTPALETEFNRYPTGSVWAISITSDWLTEWEGDPGNYAQEVALSGAYENLNSVTAQASIQESAAWACQTYTYGQHPNVIDARYYMYEEEVGDPTYQRHPETDEITGVEARASLEVRWDYLRCGR